MRILEVLLVRRRWVLVLWIALAAAAIPGLARLTTDNSAEVFFVRDAERMERYRRFQMDFGRDRSVRLVVSGPALATREGLAWLGRLEERAALLRGAFGAAGLSMHHRHRYPSWPPDDPAVFWDDVRSDPLDVQAGFTVGGESDPQVPTATVLVALYNLPVEQERETLQQLEELLAEAPPGLDTTMVGLPMLQRAMDEEMVAFGTRVVPLLGLVALVLLGLALRHPGAVLLPWIPTTICLVIVLGFRGWVGRPINMVEILLVPLLFVIALATAVHVQMRFRDLSRASPEEGSSGIVLATYREKGWPVLWTGLTTLVGFGSLAVSAVPPVRSLGIWAAGGLALITVAMLTLLPALLATAGRWLAMEPSRRDTAPHDRALYDRWAAARGRAWATWATRPASRRLLMAVFGGLALVALAGLPRLEQDTDLVAYFPPDHPVREEMTALEAQGLSTGAAELVLTAEDPSAGAPFDGPEGLEAIARVSSTLREVPGVLGVVSAGELWRSARGESLQESPITTYARLSVTPELFGLLRVLRTDDGRQARISVSLPMRGFEDLQPTLTRLQEVAEQVVREELPDGPVRVEQTGRYVMVLAAQQRVLATMIASLSLTLGIVAGIFLLLLRSVRWTVVALVPNLWPVLCVLGAMGWLGVPLDGTTVMIAAVVLGLAVDDTLHTFGRFRRESGEPANAAVATLEHTAPAHLLTTAMLAAGFGVCGLAGFVPIARFGALTALALVLALVADLLLLPALLAGVGRSSGAPDRM